MTGAEFRAATEALGLPPQWLAWRFQRSVHTIRSWMNENRTIPSGVSEVLDGLRQAAGDMAKQLLETFDPETLNMITTYRGTDSTNQQWQGADNPIGLPDSFHRIVCETVRFEAAKDGILVTIEYVGDNN